VFVPLWFRGVPVLCDRGFEVSLFLSIVVHRCPCVVRGGLEASLLFPMWFRGVLVFVRWGVRHVAVFCLSIGLKAFLFLFIGDQRCPCFFHGDLEVSLFCSMGVSTGP
jgi:hypothetical protein